MKSIDELLNGIEKKKLLLVFPHPDDETVMAGGLLQQAKQAGWQVRVVCLTCGEAGQNYLPANGEKLADIRKDELGQAMRELGVVDWHIEHFPDGKLKGNKKCSKWLSNISWDEYGLVVTYGPSGISGHPDHIASCIGVKEQLLKIRETQCPGYCG